MNKIVIHSHFYQPDRTLGSTGRVWPQRSAVYNVNWNERIVEECYMPNAYSRVLNANGTIKSIRNNYSLMSFDYGPTLLEYLVKYHPTVVEKIVQGDEEAANRTGHGNAIAQSYNHTILPLDTPSRANFQILAGLSYFEKIFGRKSEGFWCPECAINPGIIDLLASQGVKFVVLSPLQITELTVLDKSIPASRLNQNILSHSYWIHGKKSKIAAFFYNSALSSQISFNHLLRNSDNLLSRINEISKNDAASVVIAATDGEIYGHHEPFADMCFSSLADKLEGRDEWQFTNFASLLEAEAPIGDAKLFEGADGLGSSWSCSHGVERWRNDCGCSTGGKEGWHQKWRAPLREAFEFVYSKVVEQLEMLLSEQTQSILDEFARDYDNIDSFISKHDDLRNFRPLFQAYKAVNVAFTSCAWFFSDIAGIEARQNISSALNAIRILKASFGMDIRDAFMDILSRCEGNTELQDGTKVSGLEVALEEEARLIDGSFMFAQLDKNQATISNQDASFGMPVLQMNQITNISEACEFSSQHHFESFDALFEGPGLYVQAVNALNSLFAMRPNQREQKFFSHLLNLLIYFSGLGKDKVLVPARMVEETLYSSMKSAVERQERVDYLLRLVETINVSGFSRTIRQNRVQNYFWDNRDKFKEALGTERYDFLLENLNFSAS